MDMTHLRPFLDAMHRRDAMGLAEHLSDGVVLRSPILPQAIEGKATVCRMLGTLLGIVDAFDVTGVLTGESRAAVFLTIRSGDVTVDGVDDLHLNEAGLVSAMTIQWRPLPAVVAMQRRLAPLIGAPALTLVPA